MKHHQQFVSCACCVFYFLCGCSPVACSLIQGKDEGSDCNHIPATKDTVLPQWQSILSDISSLSKNTVIRLFDESSSREEHSSNEEEDDDGNEPSSGPSIVSNWRLHSTDGVYQNIPAHVPGDLLRDLMKNGIIEDPYYGRNWLTQRRIWMGPLPNDFNNNNNTLLQQTPPPIPRNLEPRTRTWVYSTTFRLPQVDKPAYDSLSYMLVIEGIKMGAMVSLNGVSLIPQNITDQFLRYILPLPQHALERGESLLASSLSNSSKSNSGSDSVMTTNKLHTLTVTFDPSIGTNGRFMACSGGWDWAPYSRAGDERGSRILSLGLVQPIYIVPVHDVYVTSIVPKIYYIGSFPRVPLSNQEFDNFMVHVHVTVQFVNHHDSINYDYVLLARSDFTNGITRIPIQRPTQNDKNQVDVLVNWTVSKDKVDLWWPNNMGQQPLYKLQVAIAWNATTTTTTTTTTTNPANGDDQNQQHQSLWMERRIGFRTLALVTVNDTNDDIVNNLLRKNNPLQEGTGQHGMYIRINGAVVSSRGANVIPMDQLEGRWSDMGHKRMVESAAAMGMNMLRVWGGGAVLPPAFYNACDELGILLYHDLMFVQEQNHEAPSPLRLPLVTEEVDHIVQTLSHHPSIVLYAGCNECLTFDSGTIDAYELLLQTLAQVDDTRAIWPVSPSRVGWKTGVQTLDGRPIPGRTLKANREDDYSKHTLEEHGPYGHGVSLQFPTVNQIPSEANYTANVPPILSDQPTGIIYPNTFVSEFGASVFSSFESMSATLPRESWSIHGNLHGGNTTPTCQQDYGQVYFCNGTNIMTERNYACDNHIEAFFGVSQNSSDEIGAPSFQRQLYLCMISQTLWMKSQIETMRSQNSFGLLIWQLNENWPTGGWGVIEYGPQPVMTGQVVGGRWKPLAYLLRDVLYRPVFAACGENLCYVRNDSISPIDIVVKLEAWSLQDNKIVASHNHEVHLNAGPGSTQQFQLPHLLLEHADMALIRIEHEPSGELLMKNSVFLWQPPKSLPALSLPVQFVYQVRASGDSGERATIRLHSDRLALYVVLSTEVNGHFSDNVFHLRPNQVVEVDFEVSDGGTVDIDALRRTLRIEHLGSYYSSRSGPVDNSVDEPQRPSHWLPLWRLFPHTITDAKIFLRLRMF